MSFTHFDRVKCKNSTDNPPYETIQFTSQNANFQQSVYCAKRKLSNAVAEKRGLTILESLTQYLLFSQSKIWVTHPHGASRVAIYIAFGTKYQKIMIFCDFLWFFRFISIFSDFFWFFLIYVLGNKEITYVIIHEYQDNLLICICINIHVICYMCIYWTYLSIFTL